MATRSQKGGAAGGSTGAAASGGARPRRRASVRASRQDRAKARARGRQIPKRTPTQKLHAFLTRQGSQTKLTMARIETLQAAVRAGIPLTLAAEAIGVSRQTLYSWKDSHPYIADIWTRAEAQHAVDAVRQITGAAGEGDWRAAAWWLERRRGEEFTKTTNVKADVTGNWASLVTELDTGPSAPPTDS